MKTTQANKASARINRGLTRAAAVLILFVALAVASGCQVSTRGFGIGPTQVSGRPIPCERTFWSLYKERNVRGRNDCSNKSGRFAEALQRQGIDATLVVVSNKNQKDLHAVVQTPDGRTYDPVYGRTAANIDEFGEVKFVVSGRASTWGAEFR